MSDVPSDDTILEPMRLTGVHLNGSVNLPDAEAVLRTAGEMYGSSLKRLPDGETGPRQMWILAMLPKFETVEQLVKQDAAEGRAGALDVSRDDGPAIEMPPVFRLRDGARPEDLVFGELGYASAALASYSIFTRLRDEGSIAPDVRFQVSMPTPFAASRYAADSDAPAVMAAFSARLRLEIDTMTSAIPHDDLAIQWDVAFEFGVLEGIFTVPLPDPFGYCVGTLVELADFVPADVELGYHLCYGDIPNIGDAVEGQHFVEPKDTSTLVAVANAISAAVGRSIDWFSMPVPIARDDDDYFRPLADLALHPETELYLGLAHHQDGVEGAQRRIAVARRFASPFGITSECGLGRKPPELVLQMLELQRDLLTEAAPGHR